MNKYIIIVTIVIEYFIWVAWLRKDGFFEMPYYESHLVDALKYTWYRFYFSLPKVKAANAIYFTSIFAEKNKSDRLKDG